MKFRQSLRNEQPWKHKKKHSRLGLKVGNQAA
jgi:hypothetical protein